MSFTPASSFRRLTAPGTSRAAIQLTHGPGDCYPLYYFIDSLAADGSTVVHHRCRDGDVQLEALNLESGATWPLTSCPDPGPSGWWPWCTQGGTGVLDHRAALAAERREVIYCVGQEARRVGLDGRGDALLLRLPNDRIFTGQNCISGDGEHFVWIDHDRHLYDEICSKGFYGWGHLSRGTRLMSIGLRDGVEHCILRLDAPIHHVQPYGREQLLFCHPAVEMGMMLTDMQGGWFTQLRTQDAGGGQVCHFSTSSRGILYEVLFRHRERRPPWGEVLAGIYDPVTKRCREIPLPSHFAYTHTAADPDGLLLACEDEEEVQQDGHTVQLRHELWACLNADAGTWERLCGHWPTYRGGQRAHFHPRVMPGRQWMLMTAGDPVDNSNQLFLLDISDVPPTHGLTPH